MHFDINDNDEQYYEIPSYNGGVSVVSTPAGNSYSVELEFGDECVVRTTTNLRESIHMTGDMYSLTHDYGGIAIDKALYDMLLSIADATDTKDK